MRPRVLCTLIALALGLLQGAAAAHATVVYGANQVGQMIAIDLSAQSTTAVGTLLFGTQAIDQDPATGYVYYFERTTSGDQLAYWNPTTRTNTVVRTYVPPPGFFAKRMAFSPAGTLYMMDQTNRLYTIDKTNGNIVHLGKVNGFVSGSVGGTGDMAFAPDGTLYAVTYQNLYTVNITARTATLRYANLISGTTGLRVFTGLAYCNGALYASDADESSGGSSVMRIDPATGTVTNRFASIAILNDLSSCPAGAAVAPTAGFSAVPGAGQAPLTVAFTDLSTGSPTSWAWDFQNDGIVDSTATNPQFTYTTPGVYTVKLTASNGQGADDEVKTNLITVSAPTQPPPTAGFSVAPGAGQAPLTVAFTDLSTGSPTSWAWDFQNDGIVDSTATNPQFTYTTPGVYTVKLTASNGQGADDEVKTNLITVSAPGAPPTFSLTDDAVVAGDAPARNFGQAATLAARASMVSHLKFTVTGMQAPSRVTLRLFVTDATTGTVTARAVANTTWSESTITWQTAPALGASLGSTTAAVAGAWVELDLGVIPGNGTYGFAITTPTSDVVQFSSTEGTNPPQLLAAPA